MAIELFEGTSDHPRSRLTSARDSRNALPVRAMVACEAVALLLATFASQLIRFGTAKNGLELGFTGIGYGTFSVVLSTLWFTLLSLLRSGRGPEELFSASGEGFRDLTHSTIVVVVVVALYSAVAQAEISRGYLLAAIPLGLGLLLVNRLVWCAAISRARARGRYSLRALIIGTTQGVHDLARLLEKDRSAGLRVCGQVRMGIDVGPGEHGRVMNDHLRDISEQVSRLSPDVVMVAGSASGEEQFVREVSWVLEGTPISLVVSPQVGPISSRRLQTIPVAGHSLIRVNGAQYSGLKYLTKRSLDLIAGLVGLVLCSPVLLVAAIMILREDSGPVFFTQTRVGRTGTEFRIYKLRTMVVGAESMLPPTVASVPGPQDPATPGSGPLFKMIDDPRMTRIGRILRRFSIDELPQLLNVVMGHMSLVGPRPPLPTEVAAYEDAAVRRLLTKPGLTGPWQVGGRSDLDWEEGLSLDLLYVENWTLLGDFVILAKTVGAVVHGKGAY